MEERLLAVYKATIILFTCSQKSHIFRLWLNGTEQIYYRQLMKKEVND